MADARQKAEITGCRVIRLSGPDKGRGVGEPERSQRLEGWPCPDSCPVWLENRKEMG